ncbi:MAG TPA: hypothetical protein VGR71_05545 [Nitrospira sp.]|nr:hypothetical protein [Nitrospira sp.]
MRKRERAHEIDLLKRGLSQEDAKIGARFLTDIFNSDNLAAVIRAHLYLENSLNLLIEEHLSEPGAVDIERQSFGFKVDLAVGLDVLPLRWEQPLLVVNSFRNRLAHDIEARITQTDVDRLFKSFNKFDRQTMATPATLHATLAYLHGCLYGQLKRARNASKPKRWKREADACRERESDN